LCESISRFSSSHPGEGGLEDGGGLLQEQDREQGFWKGGGPVEGQEPLGLVATSFALMFLAHDRTPGTIAPR
jgi:hypothetical protein